MNKWIAPLLPLALFLGSCGQSTPEAKQPVPPALKPPVREGNAVRFDPSSPQLSRIRLASAESADVPVDELIAPGKVELNPGRVSRVTLPFAGRVREVLVALGDAVTQGQTILTVESQEASSIQSALRQAEANLGQAKANLAKSEADLSRTRDLLANRAIAQKEVLTAETVVAQSKAGVELAMATRDDALRRLQILGLQPGSMSQLIQVKAPIAGKVIDIAIAAGEFRSDTGVPTLTIADTAILWVSADVPENSLRLIAIGESVAISFPALPDEIFKGRVKRIADMVDPQTRTVKVRAELVNSGNRLRPEMFATIRHSHGSVKATVIPQAAIYQQQDRATVYRQRSPGVFEEVPVTVTWQDGQRSAVKSVLQPGDKVVVDGVTQIRAY